MPGPRRLPLNILKNRGSWRYKARLAEGCLNLPASKPKCPAYLSADAKKVFKKLTNLLFNLGIVSVLDEAILARYSSAFCRWIVISEKIADLQDEYYLDAKGTEKVAALVTIESMLSTNLRAVEREFGLTAAARSSLKLEKETPDNDDDLENFGFNQETRPAN